MQISSQPLIEGILLKRYKRFLADVKIQGSGETVLVHVPNSGSMIGVKEPGSLCRISKSENLKRKIPYTLEMVKSVDNSWVGVNTSLTNKLVKEAYTKGLIKPWRAYGEIQSEVKINSESRLDFLLKISTQNPASHFIATQSSSTKSPNATKDFCYVEVKNVSMARPPLAVFPDAVTERGQKHLRDLMSLAEKGFGAELMFVVQREDCDKFKPCDDIDPVYGQLLREAAMNGVKIRCWACEINHDSITLRREIEVDLSLPRSEKNAEELRLQKFL